MPTPLGHLRMVFSVSFSPDGKRIVTGDCKFLVKIFIAETGVEVSSFVGVRCR